MQAARSSTSRSRRFCSGRLSRGSPRRDCTKQASRRRGEAVRPRPRFRPRTRRGAPRVHRRVTALPDRPLPREDGPRGDPLPPVRERDVRAGLEPKPLASVQITMAEGFGVEDRGHFYDPVGALSRRGRQPPDAGGRRRRDGGACPRPRRRPSRTRMWRCSRAMPAADPAHYVRGQYEGYREIDGVAEDSTTETYAALRLEIDNWRWAGVPFFIRTGKCLPVTQTEVRLVFEHPPRLATPTTGAHPARAEPAGDQARSLDRNQACSSTPSAATIGAGANQPRHGVRASRGARARRPMRCCSTRRCRRQHALHPPGQRRGDVADHAAAARAPRRSTATRRVVGPEGRR